MFRSGLCADCIPPTCYDPLTNSRPGSPCTCVLPIKVGLRLSIALFTFFPLVFEFAQEIAFGTFMDQSQVRIMGANAASEEPDKTDVLIDLLPLGDIFENSTVFLVYERFWHKQVFINSSYFGDYEVLYVRYPGWSFLPDKFSSLSYFLFYFVLAMTENILLYFVDCIY